MFVLPLKTGPRVDIRSALVQWLDDPVDPSTDLRHNPLDFVLPKPKYRSGQIAGELMRLQGLRNDLLLSLPKPNAHAHALANRGLTDAMEYHATLLAFERQGFTSDKCCASTTAMIPYQGAFAEKQSEAHGSLVWDRAVTVYNIAALLMYQASVVDDTHDRDGCKQAIAHCQQAAYLLHTCKDLCASMTEFSTVDLSGPLLTVAASSCLAYAQACVCQMIRVSSSSSSSATNKKTLSVLLQATHTLYNTVLEQAQDPRLQSDIPKPSSEWAAEAKLHSMVYAIHARWVQSQALRDEYQYGVEIATLQHCHEQCQTLKTYLDGRAAFNAPLAVAAIREYKTIAPQVWDRLEDVLTDNRSTYHEVIPQAPPPLEGKQLAKPAVALPPTMLEPIQPLFQALAHVHVAL
jgi:BRO1-like domain